MSCPLSFFRMAESTISSARYTYIHDDHKGPLQTVDTHSIVFRRNAARGCIVYLSILLLITNYFLIFIVKDNIVTILLWSLLLGAFLVKLLSPKSVEKESVIILPAFGVQLETHYGSGRTIRRFVPISKVLKAVLNECVTPVTCYWSLSLILRGEEELMLAFKELMPPLKMLVPIWKALCTATDSKESPDAFTEDEE